MIAASLSQQVSYATWSALRFKCEPAGITTVQPNQVTEFRLNTTAFPYMPNLLMFSIAPDYNLKYPFVCGRNAIVAPLKASKMDRRLSIYELDLVLNTTSDGVPHAGGSGNLAAQVVNLRLNSRQLYRMTLENCSSWESFPYSYDEWMAGQGFVALTSAQISGIVNSPCIRGQITIQGTIRCQNNMGYTIYCGSAGQPTDATPNGGNYHIDGSGVNTKPMERFAGQVVGYYTNKALVLDAKAGLLQESVFSEQFGQSLRLAGGGGTM